MDDIIIIVLVVLLLAVFIVVASRSSTKSSLLPPSSTPPPVVIEEKSIGDHYLFQPGMDSFGSDISCNEDLDFTTSLNKCYSDPNCKSVVYTKNVTCRKTSNHVTGGLPGNLIYGPNYGLYIKK